MKVYIWGTGKLARRYLSTNEVKMEDVLGFIESKKRIEVFLDKSVLTPTEASYTTFDYVIVCVAFQGGDIYQQCRALSIPTDKLIFVDNWMWMDHSSMDSVPRRVCIKCCINQSTDEIRSLFPKLAEMIHQRDNLAERYLIISRNGSDLTEKDDKLQTEDFSDKYYQTDYVRYRTFEMIAKEINNGCVEGAVAEAGVFQGKFARLINAVFPDRKIYLFDTFESFDQREFEKEFKSGSCSESFYDGFKDTNEKLVLSTMLYPERCVIRKGLFPETAKDIEDSFAFVSLDMDFEQSILEGLRYFYPRLLKGGYIFIHDYNNFFLEGVRKAVQTYEKEMSIKLYKVPIADEGGTLIITK